MKTYRKAIYMRIFVEAGRRVYYTVNSAVRTGTCRAASVGNELKPVFHIKQKIICMSSRLFHIYQV